MPNLLKSFQNFIKKHELIKPQDKVLIAVSGGIDSVVLTHLLNQTKYALEIAHCNFGLRGADSDQDEAFVRALAKKSNIPIHVKSFDTEGYANKNKVSIQMAARDLRYNWFRQLLKTEKLNLLTTAHHAGDQVETILFNLTKGTGISGLRGMKVSVDQLIRPLLFASKDEIERYARENQLTWREDVSNTNTKYHRNRLRHQVIPELKAINPNIEQTISITANRLESIETLVNHASHKIETKHLHKTPDGFKLDLDWLNLAQGGLAILENILKKYGVNYDQCINISTSLKTGSGNQFNTNEFHLLLDRNALHISKELSTAFECCIDDADAKIEINNSYFSFEIVDEKTAITGDKNIAMLDADLVSFPMKARNWKTGDRFYPLGMKQEKKVSDFMIDEKIPVNLKKRLVLFESNNEVIWIAGYRISDRYKITPKTKSTLIIKMINNA